MEILINEELYPMTIHGTVGLVYLAERMLGKSLDLKTIEMEDELALYYVCFVQSNRQEDNLPDLATFIANLTSPKLNKIRTWFWDKWRILEGESEKSEEAVSEPKNA